MDWRHARNLLIVGGSFDPPHIAHLIQPRRVAQAVGAEALLYIPAGRQPHKPAGQTPAEHRLAMLRLMVARHPDCHVSTLEIDRLDNGRPSYTFDTLLAIRQIVGTVDAGGPAIRLLMGSDQALAFHTWHEPGKIIELAEPVVMARPPLGALGLLQALGQARPQAEVEAWAARIVEVPLLDISSIMIREDMKKGRSVTGLVEPSVEDYIRQHGLYRD